MKTWIKILLGIVGAIVLIVAGAFYFTSGVAKVGDDFFAAIRSGDTARAYGTLSTAFRADTSDSELAAYLADNRMDRVNETSWSSRSAGNGRGSLVGTLTTTEGESVPVEIDLIDEQGQWKIYAIRKGGGTAGVGEGAKGLPGEKRQVALAAESIGVFVDTLAAGDMTGFHEHVSRLWAKQFDVAALDEAYKSFYAIGPNLQVIKTLSPIFDAPATLSEAGVMQIKGYYPTNPSRFHFDLKYIYEGTDWKLMGLSVNLKKP